MTRTRLIVICGLPGSGKTTLARSLAERHNAIRMCPDEWMADLKVDIWDTETRARIEALQWKQTQELLAAGVTVIIEWGTWARSERDTLREHAQQFGVSAELHYLDVPADELWRRVSKRATEQVLGSRAMTSADMDGYIASFQAPDADELVLFDSSEKYVFEWPQ